MGYEQAIIIKRQGLRGNIDYVYDVLSGRGVQYFDANKALPHGEMPGDKDARTIIFSLGGDGTMLLSMVASLQYKEADVVGINFGNLGFLTDDHGVNETGIEDILNEAAGFRPVEKSIISVSNKESGNDLGIKGANDVVLGTAAYAPPMIFSAKVLGQTIFSFRGTGVMLSTPTGSTAMSMSNGGPVLAPGVNALVVSPILPHGLSLRPVIIPCDIPLTFSVKQPTYGMKSLSVVADGRDNRTFKMDQGDEINLSLDAHQKARVLENEDRDFFNLLTHKMGWGSGPKL